MSNVGRSILRARGRLSLCSPQTHAHGTFVENVCLRVRAWDTPYSSFYLTSAYLTRVRIDMRVCTPLSALTLMLWLLLSSHGVLWPACVYFSVCVRQQRVLCSPVWELRHEPTWDRPWESLWHLKTTSHRLTEIDNIFVTSSGSTSPALFEPLCSYLWTEKDKDTCVPTHLSVSICLPLTHSLFWYVGKCMKALTGFGVTSITFAHSHTLLLHLSVTITILHTHAFRIP